MLENTEQRFAEIEAQESACRQRLTQAAIEAAAARMHLANRENARKSTGPRTEAGKAIASRNRLAHGLCSSSLLVFGETQAEFDALRVEAKTFDFMMDLTDRELSENGTLETDQSTEAQLAVCCLDAAHLQTMASVQRYVTANERSYRQALKALQDAIKRWPVQQQPVVEKPKAAAAGRSPLPEIGFEPQFAPNRPESAPAYTDRS